MRLLNAGNQRTIIGVSFGMTVGVAWLMHDRLFIMVSPNAVNYAGFLPAVSNCNISTLSRHILGNFSATAWASQESETLLAIGEIPGKIFEGMEGSWNRRLDLAKSINNSQSTSCLWITSDSIPNIQVDFKEPLCIEIKHFWICYDCRNHGEDQVWFGFLRPKTSVQVH